jgi:hypothetical protein
MKALTVIPIPPQRDRNLLLLFFTTKGVSSSVAAATSSEWQALVRPEVLRAVRSESLL